MLLFVGLGNPGKAYARNRHNVGFMAVEAIARSHRFSRPRRKFSGLLSEGEIRGEKILILEPHTFMNESGRSVGEAARFYKLDPESVIVFYDEMDLAAGKLRVKRGGGHAGHNGIKSIDAHIGRDYLRVRIGVGHPGQRAKVTRHLLRDFAASDDDWLRPLLDAVAEAAPYLVAGDADGFMTRVALLAPPPKAESAPATEAGTPGDRNGL